MNLHPTPESIAAAKAQQQAERQVVFEQTGLRFEDEPLGVVRIHCPRRRCRFVVSARSEGRAIRALATHLLQHIQEHAE